MTAAERRIARLVIARGQVSKAEIELSLDYSHPTVVNARVFGDVPGIGCYELKYPGGMCVFLR